MNIEIKHRWNNEIIFAFECGSKKEAVVEAVKQNKNLCDADLCGADLRDADLSRPGAR